MKKTVLAIIIGLFILSLTGCAKYEFTQTDQYIVTPKQVTSLLEKGAVLIDARPAEDYAKGHIAGAVNIPMSALMVNKPYSNMLPEAKQVGQVMGSAGINESTTILVYDDAANMQAARIQWTLNIYGNFNVKVVSGGLKALTKEGAEVSSKATTLPAAEYKTGEKQKSLIVNYEYIQMLINNPEENTVIIDTRSSEEYNAGTIPGAVHIEYTLNNYASGQYKSSRDIQSTYLGKKILPEMKIIVFCKTSVRAAQTYTALKDAGYQDVRVYDGAWLEYSDLSKSQTPAQNPAQTPAQTPAKTPAPSKQDAS